MKSNYRYRCSCIESTYEKISTLTEKAGPITYDTFCRKVNKQDWNELLQKLGYDTGTSQRGGLRIKDDWHVGYYSSTYEGKPCVYLEHSRIEYIFVEE